MLEVGKVNVSSEIINSLYNEGELSIERVFSDNWEIDSCFVLLRSEETGQSAIGCIVNNRIKLVAQKGLEFKGLTPKDLEQTCFFHALKEFDLVVGVGSAGTGKTTISLAYALDQLFKHSRKIVLCKPTHFVGISSNAIAPIPGDHRDKMEGYISSYLVALKRLFGRTYEHHLYQLEEEESLTFMPIELVRGMEFEDCTLIIDEAQNTTLHELMSIISRVGKNSKCIVLGDLEQVDTTQRHEETGLCQLVNSNAFFENEYVSGVRLKGQHRGKLAQFASLVLSEYTTS